MNEVATNVGTEPDVKKVEIIITPQDKIDAYKPVKLQVQIHACFELGMWLLYDGILIILFVKNSGNQQNNTLASFLVDISLCIVVMWQYF